MDFKIVLMAIVLSTLVLVFWATFFEPPPPVERKILEDQITKSEEPSSPSIEKVELSKKVEGLLKTNFKNKLFNTKINRNVRLAEAPDDGKPAIMYDVNCSGATDYMDLALEIINGKK